jgi:hypothetical protein
VDDLPKIPHSHHQKKSNPKLKLPSALAVRLVLLMHLKMCQPRRRARVLSSHALYHLPSGKAELQEPLLLLLLLPIPRLKLSSQRNGVVKLPRSLKSILLSKHPKNAAVLPRLRHLLLSPKRESEVVQQRLKRLLQRNQHPRSVAGPLNLPWKKKKKL